MNKLVAQVITSTATAMLSPYVAFIIAGNELAATGVSGQLHFKEQGSQYERMMWDYIDQRKKEEYATDKTVNWDTQLDLSGRPKFEYKEVPFMLRIASAGIPIVFLILFNIVFFVLAVRSLLRYDVR